MQTLRRLFCACSVVMVTAGLAACGGGAESRSGVARHWISLLNKGRWTGACSLEVVRSRECPLQREAEFGHSKVYMRPVGSLQVGGRLNNDTTYFAVGATRAGRPRDLRVLIRVERAHHGFAVNDLFEAGT